MFKYVPIAHDKRVLNNQYVSYALLSLVGSKYLPGLCSEHSNYEPGSIVIQLHYLNKMLNDWSRHWFSHQHQYFETIFIQIT